MVFQVTTPNAEIIYPDSDGKPMADNTKQFRWIVTIKENLELIFANQSDVFVAGELLWYPVEGSRTLCQAPDVMVVFGRPKGDRGSYKQWTEANINPQVVFKILSPGNRLGEMAKKFQFYDRYGVEEYYIYDPDDIDLTGWLRKEDKLEVINEMNGWVSPRLGVRFEVASGTLEIFRANGEKFLSFIEIDSLRAQERQRANQEQQRADEAVTQLEAEKKRNEALVAKLREMGIDAEQI
ncbi:Uma2 family endonuclease [Synechocystis sp. PCC 7509]|uniref:Uma2 family endonuclease n=1 Tax=Synechocystis sp. PCC 7509 TaxID=927677 RepID=UPI0002AC4450|nr:Uma2 family endonuclease [Synechocystis sp. PCC 7509]